MVLVVLLILTIVAPSLSFIEVRALDFLYALRPSRAASPDIAVVDIGEDPDAYERWRDPRDPPSSGCEIPRLVYAEAARRLSRWGARAIVFDTWFRRSCPYEDKHLADAFRSSGNVIVAATTKTEPRSVSLQDPVDPLLAAVWAVGSPVVNQPNADVRSVPLVLRGQDSNREYLALSLLAFECLKGATPHSSQAKGSEIIAAGLKVPVQSDERIHLLNFDGATEVGEENEKGVAAISVVRGANVTRIPEITTWNAMLVNWAGPQGTFKPRGLDELLAITDDDEGRRLYGGKAVLIGRLQSDVLWTAVGAMPGLEIHANALQTLLSGEFIRPLPVWGMFGLLALFATGTGSVVRRLKGARAIGSVLLAMALGVIVARQFMVGWGIWVYLFTLELGIGLSWGLTAVVEGGKMAGLLARFVPSFIERSDASDAGQVQTMDASILFSDIRGFTGTAEQLPAADVLSLLNSYQSAAEEVIARHGGTIVKTPGDAILAVFWKHTRGLSHAVCALQAGKEMLTDLPKMTRAWEAMGVEAEIGVGINAGQVAIGLVGTHHLEPTVIGDAVNVAQRLEGLTKTLDSPLIFSESIRECLPAGTEAVCLDQVTVRGRGTPLKVYGLPGLWSRTVRHHEVKDAD